MGGKYKGRVRARYQDKNGPWAEVRFTLPTLERRQTVTGLTGSSDVPGTITLNWVPPMAVPPTYEILWNTQGNGQAVYAGAHSTANYYTITGLELGAEYRILVRSVYPHFLRNQVVIYGPFSNEVRITVTSVPKKIPTPAPQKTPTSAPKKTPTSVPKKTPTPEPQSTPTPEPNPSKVRNLRAVVSVRISDDNPNTTAGLQRFMSGFADDDNGRMSKASGASDEVRQGAGSSIINHDSSVVLSWDAPPGPAPDGYRIYRLKYAVGKVVEQEVLDQDTESTGTTFTDSTTETLTFYGYMVSALIGDNEGKRSNEIRLTTNPVANTPTSPVNLSATQNEQGHVVLTWTEPEYAPLKPCTYDVYRDHSVNASELSERSYTDTHSKADTVYLYGVWATCGGYKGSHALVSLRTDTRASGVPFKPYIYGPSWDSESNGIVLEWFVIGDPTVTNFVISRSISISKVPSIEPYFPELTIPIVDDIESDFKYVDNEVIEGSLYQYTLKSENAQNELSDPVIKTRRARRVNTRPVGVTNLRVTDRNFSSITLQWDARIQNDNTPTITGYKIHRRKSGTDSFDMLEANLSATATSYVDSSAGLGPNERYTYYVTAFIDSRRLSKIADISFSTAPPELEITNGSGECSTPKRHKLASDRQKGWLDNNRMGRTGRDRERSGHLRLQNSSLGY